MKELTKASVKGDIAVTANDIKCGYRRKTVLDHVSFELSPGMCVGIVGINGSGKSTLLSVLAGIRQPLSGSFTCFGHDLFRERTLFPRMVGYLPQDNPLMEDLTVFDNLKLWYGNDIPSDADVLKELRIWELISMKVKSLSGGMKRRLSIACAVSENQPVLILDEPASSLDLHQKEIILDFMKSYTLRGGIILLSTHDEQEITSCDSVYYLKNGTAERTPAETAIRMLKDGSV